MAVAVDSGLVVAAALAGAEIVVEIAADAKVVVAAVAVIAVVVAAADAGKPCVRFTANSHLCSEQGWPLRPAPALFLHPHFF